MTLLAVIAVFFALTLAGTLIVLALVLVGGVRVRYVDEDQKPSRSARMPSKKH